MSSSTIVPSTLTTSVSGEWIHDSEFWFPDGDVILGVKSIAAGPQTVHLFRVHKLVLELHSPVFRKTLAIADTDSDSKSFHDYGARAIWIPQTSPKTLRYFLHFLYNPYTHVPTRILNDTTLCDGFFKLCSGLNARTTWTPMIARLYSIWPSTLSGWDNTDAYILASAQKFPRMGEDSHGQTMMLFHDDMFPEPASSIRLGRLYNILSIILPAALYHLSRIDPSSNYYKMHMEPTRSDVDSQQRLNAGLRSARWALLTTEDHCALASFKDYVQTCLNKLIAEPSPHLACKSGMEGTFLDIVRSSMATRDVLRELKLGFDNPQPICSSCITHGRRVTSTMRRDIWDQLTVILGL